MRTRIEQMATAITAYHNCVRSGNHQWATNWEFKVSELMNGAPSGSGFDGVTGIDIEKSSNMKLVLHTEYHHMNAAGYYDGWTEHTVTVLPTLTGPTLKVSGINRNGVKEYILDVFYEWLEERVEMP